MKKRYAFLVGLLFLLQLVNSCNNNSDKPAISQSVDSKQEFSKIIPKDNSGKLNFSYRMTKDYTRQTRLNIIENGFDSIFIRL